MKITDKENFEVYAPSHIRLATSTLEDCIKISIANSIIEKDFTIDIVDGETGMLVAQFTNGLAIYIDSWFYYAIAKMLRDLSKEPDYFWTA